MRASPPWSAATKRIVIIAFLVLVLLTLYRFRAILPLVIIPLVLAYALSPVVGLLERRTRIPRTLAVLLIYLALLVIASLVPVMVIPNLVQQVAELNLSFDQIARYITNLLAQPITIFDYTIDALDIYREVSGALQDVISPFATHTVSILFDIASSVAWTILILVISFYLLKDGPRLSRSLGDLTPAEYRDEIRQLLKEIGTVWNAFFRGQIILCLVVGVAVWLALSIVGVRNALALGLVAGVLELIPNVGPTIAAVPAVLIAYFQGSTYLAMSNLWFAALVIVLYVVIQQIENNYLVPNIVGRQLNLHPMVILIGILAGANLAGILGIFLAAPTLATLRVLGVYFHRKVLDLEPFPDIEKKIEPRLREVEALLFDLDGSGLSAAGV